MVLKDSLECLRQRDRGRRCGQRLEYLILQTAKQSVYRLERSWEIDCDAECPWHRIARKRAHELDRIARIVLVQWLGHQTDIPSRARQRSTPPNQTNHRHLLNISNSSTQRRGRDGQLGLMAITQENEIRQDQEELEYQLKTKARYLLLQVQRGQWLDP